MLSSAGKILRRTIVNWLDDHSASFSAAIAFYTIFSFVPLVMIALGVAGFFFGQARASHEIERQLTMYLGQHAAELMSQVVFSTVESGQSFWALATGIVVLFLGATAVFGQVQTALNEIWKVESKARTVEQILAYFRRRLLTFLMVLIFGAVFIVSVFMITIAPSIRSLLPEPLRPHGWIFFRAYRHALSFLLMALLLAMAYKILPDARIAWKSVWVGSLVTATAILGGNLLIGFYLGRASLGSAYGAAGSLVILLVWVYYTAMVFLMGAEFTHAYAHRNDPDAK